MSGKTKHQRTWVRFSGIGVEFSAAVIGFTLVGYWIGRYYGAGRWGVLIGAGLGIVGGGYNLIRESIAATKEAEEQRNRPDREESE